MQQSNRHNRWLHKLECYADRNRKNPTPSELMFLNKLERMNINFFFQYVFNEWGESYIADFYLPDHNLIVEIDGEYHDSVEQLEKDKKKDIFYQDMGFRVLRIRNEDVKGYRLNSVNFIRKTKEVAPKKKNKFRKPEIDKREKMKKAFSEYLTAVNNRKTKKMRKKHSNYLVI